MQTLKNFLICVSFTVFIFSTHDVNAKDDLNNQTLKKMEELKNQYKLPSLSVAIGKNDQVIFSEAIGFSNIKDSLKADIQTQYSVGSLAKPMTGIVLARLVDKGKLDLDSSVIKYLDRPEYTNTFSVRELASHISGVPHNTPERDIAEFKNVRDHKSPLDSFYVFESHPLLFQPGTEYKYSSNGYILLSAVIEKAANLDYVDFLQQSLWSRYGMSLTELDTSFAGKEHEATYYAEVSENDIHIESSNKRDRSFLFGGGGFISTPTDMVKMSRATYDDKYLSDDVKQVIYTPTKLRNGETNSDKYSLGWRVGKIELDNDSRQAWKALHHGGVTDNASTAYLLVIPECKTSIAFATNFVPDKFWQMRVVMANILKQYTDIEQCSKTNKLLQPADNAPVG